MKKKSEITNQHLLEAIQGLDKKVSVLDKKVDRNQQEILSGINDFSTEVEKRFDGVEKRLSNLEYNQEDISSKLNNAAYIFEVRDLEKRVEILEAK